MKEVPIQSLNERVYFTAPVYLDEGYILLSPDVPFTPEMKKILVRWGYTSLLTDGEPVETPPHLIGQTSEEGAPAVITRNLEDEQQKKQAEAFFRKVVLFIEGVFGAYREREEIRIAPVTDIVKAIMAEVRSNKRYMLSLDDSVSPAKTYVTTHSVKTALLSVAIADHMRLPPFKQIDIGTAALLHEIGLLKIPERLYLTDRPLDANERKAIVAHPVLGFRILKAAGFPAAVCLAVLEHNERLDGSGFPRGATGEKISLYGKILAVASSYNATTSRRPYRTGIDGHRGLMDLLKEAGKRYDEKVLASLVYTLSLYPIGTYVLMSNGALGIVVKPNPEDPKHPVVRLLVDETGTPYAEQPIVQTREGDEVYIARPVNKEELAKIRQGKE